MAVKMYSGLSGEFRECCELAEIPATNRQWKKWQKGQGIARMNLAVHREIEAEKSQAKTKKTEAA